MIHFASIPQDITVKWERGDFRRKVDRKCAGWEIQHLDGEMARYPEHSD